MQLVWNEGPLPNVHSVGRKTVILAWIKYDYPGCNYEPYFTLHGKLKNIATIRPHEDENNPMHWSALYETPVGLNEKVTFWAWVVKDIPEPKIDWLKVGL